MIKIIERELLYIWFNFLKCFGAIILYWLIGLAVESFINVFLRRRKLETGQERLAVFFMASALLNPRVVILSISLGIKAFVVRIIVSLVCITFAVLLVHFLCKEKIDEFKAPAADISGSNIFVIFLKDFLHGIKKHAPGFIGGVFLASFILLYLPNTILGIMFGESKVLQVLTGAGLGIPMMLCGDGEVLLLKGWMSHGMCMGSAAAFMITCRALRPSELIRLKKLAGTKKVLVYIAYIPVFSFAAGMLSI